MNLHDGSIVFNSRVTMDDNAITNALDITSNPRAGDAQLVCSNNDCMVRCFNLPTMQLTNRLAFPFCVNQCVLSHDGRLLCVVGDHADTFLVDTVSGVTIATLKGHLDFSFAAAWHPNNIVVATGNQDKTTKVWDVRYTGQSVATLDGDIGAVRSIRFTNNGRFMAVAECADIVNIYDIETNFTTCQQIDIFGEIAGVSFSPDDESFFVANADPTYGSMMEYELGGRHSIIDFGC